MKKDIKYIDERIDWSKKLLERRCDERREAVKQFVGSHYSDNGSQKKVPTNMLEMALTIYLRLLAANAPQCVVSVKDSTLKPFAKTFELVLNQIPDEIKLSETIRDVVMEAMFSIGVVKIGVAETSDNPKIGDEPFVSLVQIDDYFCDMSARNWGEVQYEGNEYWMDVEDIAKMYGVDLKEDEYNGASERGDDQAKSVEMNESALPLYGRVLLRDVYLVKENRMITYAVSAKKVLRDVPWDGPEGSPYVKLWFNSVPGNLMPLAPVSVWEDMHELANQIFRKLANQATAKKTVTAFQSGLDEEIQRFKTAQDGEAINYNGTAPETLSVGGVDSGNLAFYIQIRDLFSIFAGNLDSLGGLSPQSETAAQDKLISEAASARVRAMADAVIAFAKEIFRRLAWYTWTDPVRERVVYKTASKRFNINLREEWTPETRDGDFLDYNFDIAVFSMQDDSPSVRMQKLTNVFNTFIIPLQPMFEAYGVQIDMKELFDYIGANSNMPELANIVKFANMPVVSNVQKAEAATPAYIPHKSPVSHRVYERVNRPGATERGKNAALVQTLLGSNPQNAEKEAIGRMTS